jgi:hypothetical protein
MRLGDRHGFCALFAIGSLAVNVISLEAKDRAVAGMWLPACRVSNLSEPDFIGSAPRAAAPIAPRVSVQSALSASQTPPASSERPIERPRAIVPLYVSMASLQTLDIISTRRALSNGAQEANPIVAPIVGSAGGMIALKAGAAGAMFYIVEQMWKRNRTAAILALIGANIGYGAIVAHNFALAAER